MKGKLYRTAMVYGSETWTMRNVDENVCYGKDNMWSKVDGYEED